MRRPGGWALGELELLTAIGRGSWVGLVITWFIQAVMRRVEREWEETVVTS